jgi:toxin-antitoxin system, toxin component, fic family
VPEYPEFAWLEGIVNAVTHREYAMSGSYIKVSMYDDRLEIESPGKLPNIVTLENIKETRYSRNPRISRVLTEFGWVRELNEGVNRIYKEMADYFLDAPDYTEPKESVRLVLRNNIVMRRKRQELHTIDHVGPAVWDKLDRIQQMLLTYMINHGPASRSDLSVYVENRSAGTILARLNVLISMGIVKANGSKFAPNRTYEAILPKKEKL